MSRCIVNTTLRDRQTSLLTLVIRKLLKAEEHFSHCFKIHIIMHMKIDFPNFSRETLLTYKTIIISQNLFHFIQKYG